ncbi:MAG: sorting and assembly machinery component 50 [Flavobacteriales bacterium]|nr:sorting and assembly machinery component 50 [Flavobacteriales bacterium]
MRAKFGHLILSIIVVLMAFSSCNPTRRLQEGQSLLMKQKLKLDNPPANFSLDEDDLEGVLKQRPNRKILLLRFHLGVYNMVNPEKQKKVNQRKKEHIEKKIDRKSAKGKELTPKDLREMRADTTGWRDWLTTTVGEAPVVFDSTKAENSVDQLRILLAKNGYFNNDVFYEVKYRRKGKRVKPLVYTITPKEPYVIDSLAFNVKDRGIARRIDFIESTSSISVGERFSVEAMDEERDRIADYLNNRGYYSFTKDYITFQADSTRGDDKVAVEMIIRRPRAPIAGTDSLIAVDHKRYFIGDIFIHTDYSLTNSDYAPTDTLDFGEIKLLYVDELNLKPELIAYLMEFKKGDLYQKDRLDKTYRKFVQMPIFRSASIVLSDDDKSEFNVLNRNIYLTQMKRKFISSEAGVTHRDGLFGLSGSLNFSNRNMFRGGETGQFRISGAIEAQQPLTLTEGEEISGEDVADNIRFNTFEIGPEVSFNFNRFFPLSMNSFRRSNAPRTTISAGFNYQDRPDYERQLYQFRYGTTFIENQSNGSRIFWDIWELSTIKITKSEAFQQLLDNLNDDFLSTSYQNHLISLGRIAWQMNTQRSHNQRRYMFNQVTFETAGNLPRLGFQLAGATQDEMGSYEIGGIRFAQYFKIENDFRLYQRIDEKNSTALRIHGGIGIPGANLSVLPFEKSYYGGGSNGIRAWEPRTLGPGSYRDTTALTTFNNIAEVILETSLEYRFEMTQTLEGALFLDIGNIWLLEEDENRPGSGISANTFFDELAWGGGLGLRFDFDFFLLRLDLGAQLKDPAKIRGERWFWEPKDEYADFYQTIRPGQEYNFFPELNFNLGIGYPF